GDSDPLTDTESAGEGDPLARHSGCGLAASVELRLEGAAQQLAGHVSPSARNRLRFLAGPADAFTAALAVAAGAGLRLANRGRGIVPPPATEERTEPPKHAPRVAETRDDS